MTARRSSSFGHRARRSRFGLVFSALRSQRGDVRNKSGDGPAHLCAPLQPPRAHVWRNGRRYVWNGHRYVYGYGYNPGAAAAAGVIGGIIGAAAGYPYDCNWPDYGYLPRYSTGATTTGRIREGSMGPTATARASTGIFGATAVTGGGYGGAFNRGGAVFAGGNFGHMGGFRRPRGRLRRRALGGGGGHLGG